MANTEKVNKTNKVSKTKTQHNSAPSDGLAIAGKVFLIIAIVFTFWMIIPLIIGIFTVKSINRARIEQTKKNGDNLIVWSIFAMLLCGLIGGILTLIYAIQVSRSSK